jgi:CRISPR-associated protein Cas1
MDVEVAWFSPQSEYRPTEYLQQWVRFWFDDALRLQAAKTLQAMRLARIRQHWANSRPLREAGFLIDPIVLGTALDAAQHSVDAAADTNHLLAAEAHLTKQLYKMAVNTVGYGEFTRSKRGSGTDPANRFLDHGNYLAYGLAASATWVLGLPHGLAVLHGKTRRGGLVFDVADLVKDAHILPQAFVSAMRGDDEAAFRRACIEQLTQTEALDFMIDQLKDIAVTVGRLAP